MNPQVQAGREDLCARLRAGGRRGSAHGRRDRPRSVSAPRRRTLPRRSSSSRTSSAAWSRRPIWPRAATEAGALAVAHVDPLSLGVLEAPGNYGCQIAIGEGQAAGNRLSFGGPHFGFLAAKKELIRRMPGRIAGETVDRRGPARLRPHLPDPRAAHPAREGDLEHHHQPVALRAGRARLPLLARRRRACAGWGRPA